MSTVASQPATDRKLLSSLWQGLVVLVLLLATIVINWKMIRDGLNGMADLRWHIIWLQHFSKQLSEGIWYPRWLAGTNYGYGSPTFVFYAPFVYYVGSAIKFAGFTAEQTIIALFSIALFGSGFFFYLYGRDRWGTVAALIGALIYMTSPYLARDIYFRGGLASMWAQAWLPLILWLTERAVSQPKARPMLAFGFAVLALIHTPSLLLFAIAWGVYVFCLLLNSSWKAVVTTVGYALVGFGIASLYLLPAIVEKSWVNIETMKGVYGGFEANLFGTPWVLKPHIQKVLFEIQGIFIQEAIGAILLFLVVLFPPFRAGIKQAMTLLLFLLLLAFLMHYSSVFIWRSSGTLQMIQFPWRFLGLFSFIVAAVGGLAVSNTVRRRWHFKTVSGLIIVGILIWNFHYSYDLSRSLPTLHNPGRGEVAHEQTIKIALDQPDSGKLIDVPEYRPLLKDGTAAPPPLPEQPLVRVIKGIASVKVNDWHSYSRELRVVVDQPATINLRTYFYPAWSLNVDGNSHPINISKDGWIEFTLNSGSHLIQLNYRWTIAFTLGVMISALSLLFAIISYYSIQHSSPKINSNHSTFHL
jgi:hypothetical protein